MTALLLSSLASLVLLAIGLALIHRAVRIDNAMPLADDEECW